jgi:hypothetical protein
LTRPTKAALVLAIMISSGMAAASPEMDLSFLSSLLVDTDGSSLLSLLPDSWMEDTELSILLDRLQFEWDMSGMPFPPFQGNVDWQDALSTMTNQLNGWTAQAVSQFNTLEDTAVAKLSTFQSTASDVVTRATNLAMEQTSTWQTQGEIAFAKLEQDWVQTSNSLTSALTQIWDQSKVVAVEKFMEVEQITRSQMEEMMKVSNQLQLDATNYWDQYKTIAVDKYADFERLAEVEMDKLIIASNQAEVEASQLYSQYMDIAMDKYADAEKSTQAETEKLIQEASQLYSQYKDIAMDKYVEIEQISQAETAKFVQDASQLSAQYKDISVQKYAELQDNTLSEMKIWQSQLVELGHQLQVQAQGAAASSQDIAKRQFEDLQQMSQVKGEELRESTLQLVAQLQTDSSRISAEMKDLAEGKLEELVQFGQVSLRNAKQEYLQASADMTSTSDDVWKYLQKTAQDFGDDFVPMIDESIKSLLRRVDSFQQSLLAAVDDMNNQVGPKGKNLATYADNAFHHFNDGIASLESSVSNKVVEAKSSAFSNPPSMSGQETTTSDSAFLRMTLEEMNGKIKV